MATAEQRARANIDKLLEQVGWSVQDLKAARHHVAAWRSDYLLYLEGKLPAGALALSPFLYRAS